MHDDQPHEERAAMEAAWDALTRRFMVEWPTDRQAFGAGWQARGEYDREQIARLRAALSNIKHALGPNSTHGTSINACRAARAIVSEALASAPVATGESAEG